MNFIKTFFFFFKKNYEEIPPQVSDEAVLNKKAYEIAESSMIALLENNYNLHGIKYYRDNSLIYLTKPVSLNYGNRVPEKTYQVYITYNEFLRDTEAFRAFIENPHERTQWNFSSKEINYESGMFFNFHT